MAIISHYLASFVLNRNRSIRSIVWISLSAGIAAGLSFLTKQTIGLGAAVAVPLVVTAIVWRMQTFHRAVTWLVAFVAGVALPVGELLIWLARLSSLKMFLVAIFIKGPAAKAQPGRGDFFTRAIHLGTLDPRPMILAICAALIAVWLLIRPERQRLEQKDDDGPRWEMPAAAAFGSFGHAYTFLLQIFDYGNTGLENRAIFFKRLIPLLEFGREREGVDLSRVVLTHHTLRDRGSRDLPLGEGEAPMLKPLTDAGSGSVQEKEKARLGEIIAKVNDLFGADTTEGDRLVYVNDVTKGKLLESDTLVQQAINNSKEQFANSPDLAHELLNASFEELLKLDPKDVKSIKVLPSQKK